MRFREIRWLDLSNLIRSVCSGTCFQLCTSTFFFPKKLLYFSILNILFLLFIILSILKNVKGLQTISNIYIPYTTIQTTHIVLSYLRWCSWFKYSYVWLKWMLKHLHQHYKPFKIVLCIFKQRIVYILKCEFLALIMSNRCIKTFWIYS